MLRFAPAAVTLVRGISLVASPGQTVSRALGSRHAESTRPLASQLPVRLWQTLSYLLFVVSWLVIGAVSAINTFLTVKYRAVMQTTEENPLGLYLIQQDGNDVSLFVGWKVAGTIACLGLLIVVARYARRGVANVVFGTVAAAQGLLLWYLLT
jgi:hypothetical protein